MPAQPASDVLSRVFGRDPRQVILAQDSKTPFPRGQNGLELEETFSARVTRQNFSGFNGMFYLLADSAEVKMKVWFRITGQNDGKKPDNRVVDLQRADLRFSKPWGGNYFFYCKEDSPAGYSVKRMPGAHELKGDWCKRYEKSICDGHLCCETDAQEDYFENASVAEEKWECNGVKFLEIDHVNMTVIDQDDEKVKLLRQQTVYAHTKLRVNPKSRVVPRLDFDTASRDISAQYYGALIFGGADSHYQRNKRDGDVVALVETFFLSFGIANLATTRVSP